MALTLQIEALRFVPTLVLRLSRGFVARDQVLVVFGAQGVKVHASRDVEEDHAERRSQIRKAPPN